MTQAEKLEALFREAINNGWDYSKFHYALPVDAPSALVSAVMGGIFAEPECSPLDILFNHDFAHALFGDGEGGDYYKLNDPKRTKRKLWEHMLQEAVISRDPIGYMYEVVFGE